MPVTYPDPDYTYSKVRGGYVRAQGVAVNPYNLKRSVQNFGGKRKRVEIMIPPVQGSEASVWTQFLDDLNGMVETFFLDVTDVYPHEGLSASNVPFRLENPNISWDVEEAMRFGFSFTAIEVV